MTVPTSAAPVTTTDPFAVPNPIDAKYVNKILAGLDALIGEVTRTVYSTRQLTPDARRRLEEAYSPEILELTLRSYNRDITGGLTNYRVKPSGNTTTVEELIKVDPTCIFVRAHRDYSGVSVAPPDPRLETIWVTLSRRGPDDPHEFNVTGWLLSYEGFQKDFTAPENQCVDS